MDPEKELEILKFIEKALKSKINPIQIDNEKIINLHQLQEALLSKKLTYQEIENFIWKAVGAYPDAQTSNEKEINEQLNRFLENWPISIKRERPLFID